MTRLWSITDSIQEADTIQCIAVWRVLTCSVMEHLDPVSCFWSRCYLFWAFSSLAYPPHSLPPHPHHPEAARFLAPSAAHSKPTMGLKNMQLRHAAISAQLSYACCETQKANTWLWLWCIYQTLALLASRFASPAKLPDIASIWLLLRGMPSKMSM